MQNGKTALSDLKTLDTTTITCQQAAAVLGCAYSRLHRQAEQNPAKLGFPTVAINHRVYIPRIPFINFMEGAKESELPGVQQADGNP